MTNKRVRRFLVTLWIRPQRLTRKGYVGTGNEFAFSSPANKWSDIAHAANYNLKIILGNKHDTKS